MPWLQPSRLAKSKARNFILSGLVAKMVTDEMLLYIKSIRLSNAFSLGKFRLSSAQLGFAKG